MGRSTACASTSWSGQTHLDATGVRSNDGRVTLLWLVVWFIADRIGDREPLTFDPVNAWAGTLLLAVALDLARSHVASPAKRRRE